MSYFLKSLKLTQFKNYAFQSLDFGQRLICLLGRNGMGKTNVLDAIYYLCMTKSHFSNNDRYVVQHDKDFFRLEGVFQLGGKQEHIVAKVIPGKRKDMERNGSLYERLSEHIGLLPVVIIAPDDTRLATEGSELRRRFLDNTLSQLQASYLTHLLKYNKLLRQRNATLKEWGGRATFNPSLLSVYDDQMAEPARFIAQVRRELLERFVPLFQQHYARISGGREQVGCRYRSQLAGMTFLELMDQNREKDRVLQRTTGGIHRDDLVFSIDGESVRQFASQGQLKSFVFALKLAQYQLLRKSGEDAPFLLLDDIFDKLDEQRVQHLLDLISEPGFGQVFITDTDERRVPELLERGGQAFEAFRVEEGQVSKLIS